MSCRSDQLPPPSEPVFVKNKRERGVKASRSCVRVPLTCSHTSFVIFLEKKNKGGGRTGVEEGAAELSQVVKHVDVDMRP